MQPLALAMILLGFWLRGAFVFALPTPVMMLLSVGCARLLSPGSPDGVEPNQECFPRHTRQAAAATKTMLIAGVTGAVHSGGLRTPRAQRAL